MFKIKLALIFEVLYSIYIKTNEDYEMANLLPMGAPSRVLIKVQIGPPQLKTIVPVNIQFTLDNGWFMVAVDRSTGHLTNFKFDDIEPAIIWELYK